MSVIDLYIKRELMTDDEYGESSRKYGKTSGARSGISRKFNRDQELVDFVSNKLDQI